LSWFWQLPSCHVARKHGCNACAARRKVSNKEKSWLDSLSIPVDARQKIVPSTRFKADALVDRTVYEFYGTYYHGDPHKYAREVINEKCGFTMGELYDATISRHERLVALGYTVRFVWELDFDAGLSFSEKHPTYET
jgi:hypothetical protein